MLERAALQAGEDGLVDGLRKGLRRNDAAAARPAQGLVGGERDDVRERDRVGMGTARDEAGNVGRVEQKQRAYRIGDAAEGLGVDDPRVSGGPGDDHLGPVLVGQIRQSLEVDPLVAVADAVADEVVPLAAHVHRRPVREVTALVEPHAEHGVARLQDSQVAGQVGIGARVGLHIGVFGPEQLAGPAPGQVFGSVDDELPP